MHIEDSSRDVLACSTTVHLLGFILPMRYYELEHFERDFGKQINRVSNIATFLLCMEWFLQNVEIWRNSPAREFNVVQNFILYLNSILCGESPLDKLYKDKEDLEIWENVVDSEMTKDTPDSQFKLWRAQRDLVESLSALISVGKLCFNPKLDLMFDLHEWCCDSLYLGLSVVMDDSPREFGTLLENEPSILKLRELLQKYENFESASEKRLVELREMALSLI